MSKPTVTDKVEQLARNLETVAAELRLAATGNQSAIRFVQAFTNQRRSAIEAFGCDALAFIFSLLKETVTSDT